MGRSIMFAIMAGAATANAADSEGTLTRPSRPLNTEAEASCDVGIRPSLSEVAAAVASMRESKRAIQAQLGKNRAEVRQSLREIRESKAEVRRELAASLEALKIQAQENLRKFKEDLKQEARGKDR